MDVVPEMPAARAAGSAAATVGVSGDVLVPYADIDETKGRTAGGGAGPGPGDPGRVVKQGARG
ncbi:hypothetical protein GCM10010361_76160 [Streptomyces olivaceiscleroticus]|uniref:Uncharacterized protein n=1 Tax=Streptomyces olivaceiscleroticus TaxID=68245 RepID=A0ABP3LK56_9ACTN